MYDLDNPLNPRGTPDYLVGGGGDTPAWLPVEVSQFLSFKDGQYWDGNAEVAATALVGDSVGGSYSFTPSDISAGVGFTDVSGAALIGAALTQIEAGAVVVFRGLSGPSDALGCEFFDDPDYAMGWSALIQTVGGSPSTIFAGGDTTQEMSNVAASSAFAFAFLVSTEMLGGSINGAAAVSIATPATNGATANAFGFYQSAGWVLESIEIYDAAVKGLADLPALSA